MNLISKQAFAAAALALALGACSSSDGGDTASSSFQLVSRGGAGSAGAGGAGGDFSVEGTAGSDVRLHATGTVDASFTVHVFAPDLGANPLTISASRTLTPFDGAHATAPLGLLGDDGATAATGLWVKPGATLTLEPNLEADGTPGNDRVRLMVVRGVYVQGTVAAGRANGDDADTSSLELLAGDVVLAQGARIDLAGLDAAAGPGGRGGELYVRIEDAIVNAATIVTAGGAGGGAGNAGGAGGDVTLNSILHGLWNTGDVDTSGGASAEDGGGAAGEIDLRGSDDAGWGGAFSSGRIVARGGDGATGGGAGGEVYLAGYYNGSTVSSSEVDSSGGSATVLGSGGTAGDVEMDCWTGDVTVAGAIVANGGAGVGAGSVGGDGGSIEFGLYDDDQTFGGLIAGRMQIGARLENSGGAGEAGGAGGDVTLYAEPSRAFEPGAHTIDVYGLAVIDTSGGEGATSGGAAGDVHVWNDLTDPGVIGGILVEPPVVARGGAGGTGEGGAGGDVTISTYYVDAPEGDESAGVPSYDRATVVKGAIDASGGAGADGGAGGAVLVFDHFGTEAGAITSKGGAATTGQGGQGGAVRVMGDTLTRAAAITVDGGASVEGNGGAAGSAAVWGFLTTVAGDVSAIGGSGAGVGGSGGSVGLLSTGDATSFSGTARVPGGAGATAGTTGTVFFDGIRAALTNGAFHL